MSMSSAVTNHSSNPPIASRTDLRYARFVDGCVPSDPRTMSSTRSRSSNGRYPAWLLRAAFRSVTTTLMSNGAAKGPGGYHRFGLLSRRAYVYYRPPDIRASCPMARVVTIIGTRPEIIKMAPVVKALDALDHSHLLRHSGQHYDLLMDRVFFKDMELREPDCQFELREQPPHLQVATTIRQGADVPTAADPV